MSFRSSRTSIAALSFFMAASLAMPAAHAAPAPSSRSIQKVSAALMCITPEALERLSRAVEEAHAGVAPLDKELARAQKAFEEQVKAVDAALQKAAQARANIAAELTALQEADRRAVRDAANALHVEKRNEAEAREDVKKIESEIAEVDQRLARAQALKGGESPLFDALRRLTIERRAVGEVQEGAEGQLVELRATQNDLEAAKDEAMRAIRSFRQVLALRDAEVREFSGEYERAQQVLGLARERAEALDNAGGEAGLKSRIDELSDKLLEREGERDEQQRLLDAAADQLVSFDESIAGLIKSIKDTRIKISEAQRRVNAAEAQLVEENELLDVLRGFAEETKALVAVDEAALHDVQQEVQRLEALMGEKQASIAEVSEEIERLENRAQSGTLPENEQQQLSDLRQRKIALESESEDLRGKLVTARNSLVLAEERLANGRKNLEVAMQAVVRKEQAILDWQRDIETLRAEAGRVAIDGEKSIAETETSIERLDGQKADVQQRRQSTEMQIVDINAQIGALMSRKNMDEALLQYFGGSDVEQKAREAVMAAQDRLDIAQKALSSKQAEREEAASAVSVQQEKHRAVAAAAKAGNDKIAEIDDIRLKAVARVMEIDEEMSKKRAELRDAFAEVDAQIPRLTSRREGLAENLTALNALLDNMVLPRVRAAEEKLGSLQARLNLTEVLTVEKLLVAPLSYPSLLHFEDSIAPHRAVIAEATAAQKLKEGRTLLRDRLAEDLAKARDSLAAAGKAHDDARALPKCGDDERAGSGDNANPRQPESEQEETSENEKKPGGHKNPEAAPQSGGTLQSKGNAAGQADGRVKVPQQGEAQTQGRGALASTGAENTSGVAVLIAMLGASAVVASQVRKQG